ncbi:hypothetical protein M0638_06695 [Roseomonas sp. NAR14]|uniref:PqqD family protein n=1 Tax=Roseomonas acroporae TaxID=2937791 RepID=A0A9X1YCQ0_9PROT|nr:hypothetical protein [Roseomonas acroporae]MCK8784066.1 hypothetical protein [Roseomonas acroporae]
MRAADPPRPGGGVRPACPAGGAPPPDPGAGALPDCVLAPGVRLRPVPELSTCLAYVPGLPGDGAGGGRPALHRLNVSSWLIAALCDGRPPEAVADAFARARPAPADAVTSGTDLREGLRNLLAIGVLRTRHGDSPGPDCPRKETEP